MWTEFPPDRWLSGRENMRRPVVRLRLALYGHPLSGRDWGQRCNRCLEVLGLDRVPNWEQCFIHQGMKLVVDDSKMEAPSECEAKDGTI